MNPSYLPGGMELGFHLLGVMAARFLFEKQNGIPFPFYPVGSTTYGIPAITLMIGTSKMPPSWRLFLSK
jgi:hypothetical protein